MYMLSRKESAENGAVHTSSRPVVYATPFPRLNSRNSLSPCSLSLVSTASYVL